MYLKINIIVLTEIGSALKVSKIFKYVFILKLKFLALYRTHT